MGQLQSHSWKQTYLKQGALGTRRSRTGHLIFRKSRINQHFEVFINNDDKNKKLKLKFQNIYHAKLPSN